MNNELKKRNSWSKMMNKVVSWNLMLSLMSLTLSLSYLMIEKAEMRKLSWKKSCWKQNKI